MKVKEISQIDGQLDIWQSIELMKKERDFLNVKGKSKIEKIDTPKELTSKQQKFIDSNNIMQNENLSRIIKYCSGAIGIEVFENAEYKTLYINAEGKKEFEMCKSRVLPMDQIIFYKDIFKASLDQEERLKNIANIEKVIRRKGDENILAIAGDKVFSITPKWTLEFKNIKVVYEDDEVEEISDEINYENITVGSIVETIIGGVIVSGEITREYGPGKAALSFIYADGKKQTSINRYRVTKVLGKVS